jgi:hypothetical protein
MARRADPERIFQARRDAIRNTLTDYGMSLEDAERWCDAWAAEAERLDLPKDANYWTVGDVWIAEQRAARHRPGGVTPPGDDRPRARPPLSICGVHHELVWSAASLGWRRTTPAQAPWAS